MKLSWTVGTGLAAIFLNLGGAMADANAEKPAWLTDASLGVKESYDDNVFMSGVDPKYFPASYAAPAGSVVALKNRDSWVTTVSPKLGVNFAPFAEAPTNLPLLSLAYAPDFAVYHDQTSQSYNAQRVLTAVKAETDPVTFNLDDQFAYVDGNNMGPFYPGGLLSAFATAADRERCEQIQDRANVNIQFDGEKWFVRPVASLTYYDLMTEQINVVGYQNYVDRYDVNGGPDFGWKIAPQIALTLGYRYGHQYQQQFSFSPYSSSCDYQRVLAGIEGRPWQWLSIKMQSGPDFRNYQGDSLNHITPLNDLTPVTYYGEALVTATFAPENTLTFKYKLWQWESSTGKIPLYDGAFELAYHRPLTTKLGLDLGGKLLSWDYNEGNLAACKRHDLLSVVSGGVSYSLNSHISISLTGMLNWGRNAEDDVVLPQTREFNQQLVSLGTQWKF